MGYFIAILNEIISKVFDLFSLQCPVDNMKDTQYHIL